jgi:hypothetical protein
MGNLKGRDHSEDLGNIKMDLEEIGFMAWFGYMWLRIETGGGLL